MRFMVALHHFEQWWFYPHWRSDCDVSNPEYAGLYGPMHNLDGLAEPDRTSKSGSGFYRTDRRSPSTIPGAPRPTR
jgi:hypothetical protein